MSYANHIIVLNSEGRIAEQGSFSELSTSGGYVSTFNLSPADWKFDPDEILPLDIVPRESIENKEEYEMSEDVPNADEAAKEDPSRRVGDTSVYFYYVNAIGWLPTLVFVIGICGFVVCFSLPGKVCS